MAGEAESAGRAAESLYVQLVGDGRSYGNMLNQAVAQTNKASEAIAKETAKITAAVKNDVAEDSAILQHMTESRLAKVGQRAVGSGLIIVGLVKRMLGAFQDFEGAARSAFVEGETTLMRLTGVLEANGAAVEETMAQYEEFANTMKATSTMAGTTAKQLLANAGNYGLTGNAAMRTVRDAQALAARKGGDPGQWIRALSMLEQGQVAREFMRLTPEIKKAKTEAEKIALINKFIAESQRFINMEAETAAGKWRQMKNEIDDVLEILGKTIVNAMKPFVKYATQLAKWFQNLDESLQGVISQMIQITALVVMATAAWGIFGGPIKDILFLVWSLLSSFGLLVAGIAAAGYGLWKLGEAYGVIDRLKKSFQDLVSWITEYFGPAWEEMVDSIQSGDLVTAFEIVSATARMVWIDISNVFLANWSAVAEWFTQLWTNVWSFLRDNWNILVGWMGRNWKNLFEDAWTLTKMYFGNFGPAMRAAAELATKLFFTAVGWWHGRLYTFFMTDLPNMMVEGLTFALTTYTQMVVATAKLVASVMADALVGRMPGQTIVDKVAASLAELTQGMRDKAAEAFKEAKNLAEKAGEGYGEGFVAGANKQPLWKEMLRVLKEQAAKFPNPFKDFKPLTESLPQFLSFLGIPPLPTLTASVEGFANAARDELNAIFGRKATEKEDSMAAAFLGDTAEWRAYLEEEFGIVVEEAKKYGERGGAAMSNEFAKALKFDAAEAGTAEAMARIREFMETGGIGGEGGGKGKGGALGVGGGTAEGNWDLGNGPDLGDVASNTANLEDVLKDIRSNTGKSPVVFNEAALA